MRIKLLVTSNKNNLLVGLDENGVKEMHVTFRHATSYCRMPQTVQTYIAYEHIGGNLLNKKLSRYLSAYVFNQTICMVSIVSAKKENQEYNEQLFRQICAFASKHKLGVNTNFLTGEARLIFNHTVDRLGLKY